MLPTYSTSGIVSGQPENPADLKAALDELKTILTANVEVDNMTATLQQLLSLTGGGVTRRGKSVIATSEARSNTAYGLLTTPDRVQSVVLPTDGLLEVNFWALWEESVNNAARAAIFIGANQLRTTAGASSGTIVQEASCAAGGANLFKPLLSDPAGLTSPGTPGSDIDVVSTGQALAPMTFGYGGLCYVFAAAGTYDVSVQFKASSGSVTVKERKLFVRALAF